MVIFVAPVSHCVELALFAVDFSGKFPKYVAAVPHLHSIHPSITRESKWRYIMKKINLRELYPDVYTTDFFVDVTEEVMETIRAAERAEAAYERKMYCYYLVMWSISESEVMWKTGGKNEDIIKSRSDS